MLVCTFSSSPPLAAKLRRARDYVDAYANKAPPSLLWKRPRERKMVLIITYDFEIVPRSVFNHFTHKSPTLIPGRLDLFDPLI